MVSGSNAARAYDNTTKTWNGARPISDRVSWVCLDSSRTYPEVPGMLYTNCSYALRAQIQFQSCWDGVNPYKTDNSHVAYMSAIDNGACPPTHPVQLIHLFYEVYYAVSKIDQTNGGRFVLANGDATGYGFHGDFLNGWDNSVLTSALQQCAVGPVGSGQISDCPPLAAVDSAPGLNNCPERPPLVNETVKGMLNSLPGCNVVTSGPQPATPAQLYCGANVVPPTLNRFIMSTAADASVMPQVSSTVNGWQYLGSASDATNNRALSGSSWADDSMTVEVCQQYCTSKSFPLAGVEYGRECYCDTVLNPNSTLSASFSTIYNSMTCAGNGTEFCGGPSRLLLYKNLQFSPPYPARIGDTLGAAKYLGCANDSAQGRALAAKSKTSTNMTIATCSTFCSGYALFGVEYGSECYCDNKLAATSTLGQTGCKMVCGGNSTQICGGASMLGLFNNTGTAAVTPTTTPSTSPSATASPTGPSTPIANVSTAGSFTYVGCANENNANPGRALNGSNYANSTVTNDQCTAFCASQNFKYAGTEYGQECYCGNSLELGSSLNAAGCSSKCVGTLSPSSLFAQYSSVCGGGSLLSVWRNEKYKPVQVVPSVGNYASQGCYTDATSGRALTGGTYTNASMTVEMCVGYCSGNNFKFAGVEYGMSFLSVLDSLCSGFADF